MKWFRRRVPPPRADRLTIAVLEHDVLGIQPEPGTMAAAVIGLRALGAAGASMREMMPGMDDCPATATIQLGGELCTAICNLPAGHDGQHEDLVLGEWGDGGAAGHGGSAA